MPIPASLLDVFGAALAFPTVRVVDVGANPLTGTKGPYAGLVARGAATLVGFEPDPAAFAKAVAMAGPGETYLQQALGDGAAHSLRVCRMSGMNSLLEPNRAVLDRMHLHGRWAEVVDRREVATRRLDDVAEVEGIDFLKIDIQGGELMVFQHGREKLRECLVAQTECMFVEMYEGQPLIGDQELELRRHGLRIHKFVEVGGHALKPLYRNNDPHGPLSQAFFADVVFVRDFSRPEGLRDDQLLKLGLILHYVYRSYDLAHLFLQAYDDRRGTAHAARYYDVLTGRAAPAA